MDLRVTKWSGFMCQPRRYVEASLANEERRKFNFYNRLVLDIYEGIYMHTGRESHVDSDGEG